MARTRPRHHVVTVHVYVGVLGSRKPAGLLPRATRPGPALNDRLDLVYFDRRCAARLELTRLLRFAAGSARGAIGEAPGPGDLQVRGPSGCSDRPVLETSGCGDRPVVETGELWRPCGSLCAN